MDANVVANVSDGWLAKIFDAIVSFVGIVMTFAINRAHSKADKQAEAFNNLRAEHDVLKANLNNLTGDVSEIKNDGKEMRNDIKVLLQRGGKDWRQ